MYDIVPGEPITIKIEEKTPVCALLFCGDDCGSWIPFMEPGIKAHTKMDITFYICENCYEGVIEKLEAKEW